MTTTTNFFAANAAALILTAMAPAYGGDDAAGSLALEVASRAPTRGISRAELDVFVATRRSFAPLSARQELDRVPATRQMQINAGLGFIARVLGDREVWEVRSTANIADVAQALTLALYERDIRLPVHFEVDEGRLVLCYWQHPAGGGIEYPRIRTELETLMPTLGLMLVRVVQA